MKMIDQFEAAHMSDVQFVEECWTKNYTYQDYTTNCELLKRSPLSKETFHALCTAHDTQYYESINRRKADPAAERRYFAAL